MNKTEQASQLRLAAELIETEHPWEYSPDRFSWRLSEGVCPMYAVSQGWQIRLATPSSPPFQLPPPPPSMRWHPEDGWKQGDLPQGYRPLVEGEIIKAGDKVKNGDIDDGAFVEASNSIGYTVGATFAGQIGRTTRPLVFTHEGKEWTYHRPGDPMPCDGERVIFILCQNLIHLKSPLAASDCRWGELNNADIIGWRYAETTKQVELEPEDVPPGSWLKLANGPSALFAITEVRYASVVFGADRAICKSYGQLYDGFQINRSIPLTGKWDANAWEPCSKEVPA